jgi:hypothetical protein
MKARYFNGYVMPKVNHTWAAKVLNMQVSGRGPDLSDDKKVVEIKTGLKPGSWTSSGNQQAYGENGKPAFMFLVIYELDREVSSIKTENAVLLESMVVHRHGYVVPWNWFLQFPISKRKHYDYTYPKIKLRPKMMATYEVEKGLVHLAEEVPEELFRINGRRIEVQPS